MIIKAYDENHFIQLKPTSSLYYRKSITIHYTITLLVVDFFLLYEMYTDDLFLMCIYLTV